VDYSLVSCLRIYIYITIRIVYIYIYIYNYTNRLVVIIIIYYYFFYFLHEATWIPQDYIKKISRQKEIRSGMVPYRSLQSSVLVPLLNLSRILQTK